MLSTPFRHSSAPAVEEAAITSMSVCGIGRGKWSSLQPLREIWRGKQARRWVIVSHQSRGSER